MTVTSMPAKNVKNCTMQTFPAIQYQQVDCSNIFSVSIVDTMVIDVLRVDQVGLMMISIL